METLKPPKGAVKQRKRLGRGNGTGNGTTAGKGTKGQNSRSGGGVRPGFEGGQMPLYRRVARRGFSNYPFKKTYVTVSLQSIEKVYSAGDTVSLETLSEKGLIGKRDKLVKVLADGELTKKLSFVEVKVSRSAAAKIVAAGGSAADVAGPAAEELPQKAEPKEEPAKKAPKTVDKKPAEKKPAGEKTADTKPAEKKPAAKKASEKKPAEAKSGDEKPKTPAAKAKPKADESAGETEEKPKKPAKAKAPAGDAKKADEKTEPEAGADDPAAEKDSK